MLQKGYKREGKGMAVLRCFIGLFIVFIGVLVGYSILGHDYSSGLDPTSSLRNYIEATPTVTPQMPTYTPEVSATPTITPTPTPTLSPTPTISPTPEPTAFPQTAISPYLEQGKFVVPEATTVDYRSAITHSYVSKANDNSVIELRGYGYLNDASFEGNGSQAYLVVTMESTGVQIAYQATMIDGCSGVAHTDALCANASSTDFSVIIDVSVYPDDIYSLELVMGCYIDGTPTFVTMPLPEGTSMTVLGKKVISGVPVASVE